MPVKANQIDLSLLCPAMGYPAPVKEHRFHPVRRWRFDYAWPDIMLALEVEGLTRDGGRHQRIAGYTKDTEKYNEALCLGWKVIRVTPGQIKNAEVFGWIERMLNA